MKPQRIRTQVTVNREEWVHLRLPAEEVREILRKQMVQRLAESLYDEIEIESESNLFVGETLKVDITVMSTGEWMRIQKLLNGKERNDNWLP